MSLPPSILAFFVVLLLGGTAIANVRINEFVASNDAGLADADGDRSDWIEIFHAGDAAIDLAGWTLTDDPDTPNKWTFPARVVNPGDYVVLFASGKDRADTELHTNFKLDSDGEFLALLDPDGETISELTPAFPPLLKDVSYGFDEDSMSFRFWRAPTPAARNEEDPSHGPYLHAPETALSRAQEGEDFVVSIRVLTNGVPIESVIVKHRLMYQSESNLRLTDDGDGRYTGRIPSATLFGNRFHAGEMLRWSFHAEDVEGNASRLPHQREGVSGQAQYYGTIIEDPSLKSELPILHWFAEDPDSAITEKGSRASVYFDGQFYDNLFVKRRGQFGAIQWPKAKLKFDFNPRDHFRYDPERRRLEEFNLHSHFRDASYMRENVAFAFFNEIGTPAPDTRHWRVRLNGDYYGLFSYVEQVDEDFLRQQGLDPNGALYKANGFPSTLAKGATPALYQKETRKDEPYDDLIDLTNGINRATRFLYLMDHVNVPAMVNEMAGQSVIRNADRLTKNYYMYRDPETDLWQRLPWDMDGAFSTSGNLANENFASPLYGDTQHTQAAGQAIYQNYLLDVILDYKPSRQMYLRRLRNLIDTYLAEDSAYIQSEVERRLAMIRQEALEDARKWGTGNIDSGARSITDTALTLRRRELLETFGKSLIPGPATPGLTVEIVEVDAAPVDVRGEYFKISNPNDEAIDLSGWKVSGAVSLAFRAGTVLPRKGTLFSPDDGFLFVVKDVRAFRNRTVSPRGNQGRFYVGPYEGKLSSRGETIQIHNETGQLVAEHTYAATGTTYASWAEEQFTDDAIRGWAAVSDASGLTNLYYYAFGLDYPEFDGPDSLHYERNATASDLQFTIEESSDLATWSDVTGFTEDIMPSDRGTEQVTVTLPAGAQRYYRVSASLSAVPE